MAILELENESLLLSDYKELHNSVVGLKILCKKIASLKIRIFENPIYQEKADAQELLYINAAAKIAEAALASIPDTPESAC